MAAGRWARARASAYTLPGLATALAFALLSFTPSLRPGARAWRALAVAAAVLGPVALLLGLRWQARASELVSIEPQHPLAMLLVPPLALLVFVALVAAARAVRAVYRGVAARLSRHVGPRAARALGVLLVVVVADAVATGVLWDGAVRLLDRTFAVADTQTPDDVTRPTTPLRSGSPDSLVAWEDLGREGRVYVGRGLLADEIGAITGRPALDPIRAYAGTAAAEDPEQRARLAVRDLARAGGFEREHLLVVTTTGTGWVEPSAVGSFEVLTGGDAASVSVQYSHLPSWLSFLVDQERAREAGRLLFDAVYERWSALPADARPRVYVFGESLGSFGGETAFSGEFDLRNRTSGALFVGPPNFNPLYRGFVDDRDPGSREVEPVYRDGRTVRFTNQPGRPTRPDDRPWAGPRVLYLQHPSDPITWWSPDLVLRRPDWLEEARGHDVMDETRWVPFVTFWQVTADLALGFSTEPGHGHNYTGEHVAAWAEVLRPPGWTAEEMEALRLQVRADVMGQPLEETR